jgi:hypothetical protein
MDIEKFQNYTTNHRMIGTAVPGCPEADRESLSNRIPKSANKSLSRSICCVCRAEIVLEIDHGFTWDAILKQFHGVYLLETASWMLSLSVSMQNECLLWFDTLESAWSGERKLRSAVFAISLSRAAITGSSKELRAGVLGGLRCRLRLAGGTHIAKEICNRETDHIGRGCSNTSTSETVCPMSALHFVVDRIIRHRGFPSRREYLVKWKQFDDYHNSWEPACNFDDTVISDYWKSVPGSKTNPRENSLNTCGR